MTELGLMDNMNTERLIKEANELVSIFVATVKTVKAKNTK
jgi:hypothetical protein